MILEMRDIYKSFGEKKVLQGLSLKAESCSAFGILGRNGAGKTTAIRILMNVFSPDKGEVLSDGEKIDYEKISFGYLPEERGLYPKKKIGEQLIYFAELNGLSRKKAAEEVKKWLERLSMSEYINKRLDTLSKGNQQKIQLITALAHNPDIIILDEPFSGLDPVNAKLLKDIIKEEIKKGKLVLFSSHQMNYIEEFCSNIMILNEGRAVLSGNLEEIKHSYPRNRLLVKSSQAEEIKKLYPEAIFTENGSLMIKLQDEKAVQCAMRTISEKYSVDSLSIFEPSLNDIFVEYLGDKEGEK